MIEYKDILASISSKGGKASIIAILLLSSIHANANELVIEEQNLIPYEDAKKWENLSQHQGRRAWSGTCQNRRYYRPPWRLSQPQFRKRRFYN